VKNGNSHLLKRFAYTNKNLELFIIALIICFTIVILQTILFVIPYSQAISVSNKSGSCNCIVFRMDDIQDYWIRQGQIGPMNIFISKHQPLSLGLIMDSIGNDNTIVNEIINGSRMGLFELAIHGWNHTDYTKLSEQEQKNSLQLANEKMKKLFGITSDIFFPPYDTFNNSTLQAMSQLGFKILSSDINQYLTPAATAMSQNQLGFHVLSSHIDQYLTPAAKKSIFVNNNNNNNNNNANANNVTQNQKILQLPSVFSVQYTYHNKTFENSLQTVIGNATHAIAKFGYAVVVLHPQDFMKVDASGNLTDIVDESEINGLSNLIDSVLSRNIKIASLSEVVARNIKSANVS
jgi:peptidoglycan/xylan/chitin deacetylase (PgdA/CDA1 family)